MTARNDWEFEYLGKELVVFASIKEEHHRARLAFWEEEAVRCEKELREGGMEFRPRPRSSVASNYGNTAQGLSVVIDPEMQTALNTALNKVDEHKTRLHHFELWVSLFLRNPDAVFKATFGDIDFFNAIEKDEVDDA